MLQLHYGVLIYKAIWYVHIYIWMSYCITGLPSIIDTNATSHNVSTKYIPNHTNTVNNILHRGHRPLPLLLPLILPLELLLLLILLIIVSGFNWVCNKLYKYCAIVPTFFFFFFFFTFAFGSNCA